MGTPKLAAVIEVRPDPAGDVPVDLVRAAYSASRFGTVVLVLNGVSARQVDRALDPIIARVGSVAGVVYCTPATFAPLLRQRGWTSVVSGERGVAPRAWTPGGHAHPGPTGHFAYSAGRGGSVIKGATSTGRLSVRRSVLRTNASE